MSAKGLEVTVEIEGAVTKMPDYPLLPEDLLLEQPDGTYMKVCPGIAVGGIVLTDDQRATLRPVEFRQEGLNFWVL